MAVWLPQEDGGSVAARSSHLQPGKADKGDDSDAHGAAVVAAEGDHMRVPAARALPDKVGHGVMERDFRHGAVP